VAPLAARGEGTRMGEKEAAAAGVAARGGGDSWRHVVVGGGFLVFGVGG